MYTINDSACGCCGSTNLSEVFNFGHPMPLANNFTKQGDPREGFVPVRVIFCRECTVAQLGEIVDPQRLYAEYLYTTSNSQTMLRHFDRLTKDIVSESAVGTLLEIGANDGAYLSYALDHGFKNVLGIDPAANLVCKSKAPIITGLFHKDTAEEITEHFLGSPDIIVARHCFCHQPWRGFMDAITAVAKSSTLVAIEVPYVPDLLRRVELDSIYSEHTSYLTIKSVSKLLKSYPFHIHGVLRYSIHGGAVLLMLRHNDSGIQPHLSADEMLAEECVTEADWVAFAGAARAKIEALREMVKSLRFNGKVVSMFGASAKGTVLITACGLSRKEIDFCTDNSPLKPGRLIPGTQIPIIEEAEMLSQHPDYAICAAWNFRTEILAKMEKYRKRGGKFIFPTDTGWEVI